MITFSVDSVHIKNYPVTKFRVALTKANGMEWILGVEMQTAFSRLTWNQCLFEELEASRGVRRCEDDLTCIVTLLSTTINKPHRTAKPAIRHSEKKKWGAFFSKSRRKRSV